MAWNLGVETFQRNKNVLVDNNSAIGIIVNYDRSSRKVVNPDETDSSKKVIKQFKIQSWPLTEKVEWEKYKPLLTKDNSTSIQNE